jgi:hypothetical protein
VAVVAAGDHHAVGGGISQQCRDVVAGLAEDEITAQMHRADARGCSYSNGGCRMVRSVVMRPVSQLCRSTRCSGFLGLRLEKRIEYLVYHIDFRNTPINPTRRGAREGKEQSF